MPESRTSTPARALPGRRARHALCVGGLVVGLLAGAPVAVDAASTARTTLPARVTVRECSSRQEGDHSASFYVRAQRIPRAARIAVRFALTRLRANGQYVNVAADGLDVWRYSRKGVRRFGFTQQVLALRPGGAYRVAVRVRWLDAAGHTLRSTRRRSGFCHQAGALPNLRILNVFAATGPTPETSNYYVEVIDDGPGRVAGFDVGLSIDGGSLDAQALTGLAPGERATVAYTGPRCRDRMTAEVDRPDAVPEYLEDDNMLTVACAGVPAGPGPRKGPG